jgi:catechol 2,3-dioxygenase-like lactoylglutathione lyase family enzyme
MQPQLAVPLLRVSDVARSAAWYREALGFEVDLFPEQPPYEFAILRHGPAEIMLRRGSEGRPANWCGWDVYVRLTHGLREMYAKLDTKPGTVTRDLEWMPYGDAEFDVRDPDGYVLCFSQVLADASDLPRPAV